MLKLKKISFIKFMAMIAIVAYPTITIVNCKNSSPTDDSSPAEDSSSTTIKVFQTSDIHGYLVDTSSNNEDTFQYRLAYIANLIDQAKSDKKYDDVLLLDCGDIYQGQIVSNFTTGTALRAAFDLMKYDATVLGNHEFDWGLDKNCDGTGYIQGYDIGYYTNDEPKIPILAANLYDKETGKRSNFTKDYTIVNKANKKIALIGYIPDYSADILAENIAPYRIDQDLNNFEKRVKEINQQEKPDATIVMAHANPIPLANSFNKNDVQLVAGGHEHDFRTGVSETTGITYIQSNSFALGCVEATIKFDQNNVVTIENPNKIEITTDEMVDQLYDNEKNKNNFNKQVLDLSHIAWEKTKPRMNVPIGYIEQSIAKKGYISDDGTATTGGNWISGLMKKAMDVDIAFYNTGGIRTSFEVKEGNTMLLNYGNIYTMLPFNNPLLIYELTGKQLEQQLINGLKEKNYSDQMTGLKFKYKQLSKNNYEILEMSLVMDDGSEKTIDINDEKTTYKICLTKYSATLAGSVTEKMEPINNEATALVDNEAIIKVLEEARGNKEASKFKIEVDTSPRGIEVKS